MTMTIEEMRLNADAALLEAETRLAALRAEKANIQTAIKATIVQRDDAKRIVGKLAPPKPRIVEVVDTTEDIDDIIADAEAS